MALMLEGSLGEVRGTQNVVPKTSHKTKWSVELLHFLLKTVDEKYREYVRKAFKAKNWNYLADVINAQFLIETPRTGTQTRKNAVR